MSNSAWKQFERDSASLFGGYRYPANSGFSIDFSGSVGNKQVLGQCKLVKTLSLSQLTRLVETVDEVAKESDKIGVVCAKVRRGTGAKSVPLVVMSFDSYKALMAEVAAYYY